MKTKDIVNTILLAIGVYLLYKIVKGKDDISKAGSKLIDYFTMDSDVQATGQIKLPDGTLIDASNIYVNDSMQFTYNGQTYTVKSRDSDGNYVAE